MPLFAEKEILVDLSEQKAYAVENSNIVFSGRISSGKPGRETPVGEFRILQKKLYHTSNLWPKPKGGAKMPFMMRLTNSGIAMHLGHVSDYPASHGCIRLKEGFAQRMFHWTAVGISVVIVGDAEEYRQDDKQDDDYMVIE